MHISEGIITGVSAAAYTGLGIALVGTGTRSMRRFAKRYPDFKPLLGMGGAFIFFMSLIPIPAFTGTCSHPCGTPLIGILLGPLIGTALAGVSLLLQAAFFAHGGFGTWGANVTALGFFGCFLGWGIFRLARACRLPVWAAGFAGGLVGDVAVYAVSGLILAGELATAPNAQYSFSGYLTVIYAAYLPTQLPIAFGEMLVTGLAINYAYRQRPEVLEKLNVVGGDPSTFSRGSVMMLIPVVLLVTALCIPTNVRCSEIGTSDHLSDSSPSFSGMDEAVNEHLAENAGRPARAPLIDTESKGDLWNLLLLSAGGACGFIMGRYWDLLWGGRSVLTNR